jgi:hypothetical protein
MLLRLDIYIIINLIKIFYKKNKNSYLMVI